jgi:hypothetical protein
MVSGATSKEENPTAALRELTEKCLQIVLSLSGSTQPLPEDVSGLKVLRDSLDTIIRKCEASARPREEDNSSEPSSQRSFAVRDGGSRMKPLEGSESSPEDDAFPQDKFWRSKRRTQSEKDEKKARLEKREEILRDLRARVSGFRSEPDEMATPQTPPASRQSGTKISIEVFNSRIQRASYWKRGTLDWARQLLGVELGMTFAEKRQSYLDMVKVCHPDHNPAAGPDAMQEVNEAWEILQLQEQK